MKSLRPFAVFAALALPLAAQALVPQPAAEAGPGRLLAGPIDVNAPAGGNNGGLSATYLPLSNTMLVAARGNGALTTAPHTLYEFAMPSAGSTLLNTYTQQAGAGGPASAWGHRDGTTDLLGGVYFGGDESGFYAYDVSVPGVITPIVGPVTYTANNGTLTTTVAYPRPAASLTFGLVRGLAFDPAGNGGNGSFYAANFAGAITEFDVNGVAIRSLPNTGNLWSIYGIEIDPQTGNLWVNSAPNQGDLAEIDKATGAFTGVRIARVNQATVAPAIGTAQGGLSVIAGPAAQAEFGVAVALIGFDQSTPDSYSFYRLHLYSNVNAGTEVQLRGEVATLLSGFRSKAATGYLGASGSFMQLELFDPTGTTLGLPAIVLANVATDAVTNANTLGLAEFIAPNALSAPPSLGLTFTVGDGFGLGGLAAPNFPLGLDTVGTITPAFPAPNLTPLGVGTPVRFQALVVSLTAPGGLIATNTLTYFSN